MSRVRPLVEQLLSESGVGPLSAFSRVDLLNDGSYRAFYEGGYVYYPVFKPEQEIFAESTLHHSPVMESAFGTAKRPRRVAQRFNSLESWSRRRLIVEKLQISI